MKKQNLVVGIVSIIIVLASLAFMLFDIFIPINLWHHPVLNFFAFVLIGFGILSLILGVINKYTPYYFMAVCFLTPAIFYILIQYVKWWVALIIALCVLAILSVMGVMLFGNKSENIALNVSPEYKNYQQRREEKLAEGDVLPQEEIPQLKSFKD